MAEVLVTGGAGYIGSSVTELLLAHGHAPLVLDNLSQGHCAAIAPGAGFLQADLQDPDAFAHVFAGRKIAAVIHLAAVSVVGDSVRQPLRYYRQNVGGLLNLLDAMRDASVGAIVFSSTASVYGIPEKIPVTERCAVRPINPYGSTKLLGEQILVDAAAADGLRWVALRYFNVAGATELCGEAHHPETHLIPRVLEVVLGQRPHLEIYGADYATPDGTCIRDYIHILDLAEAHVLALDAVLAASPALPAAPIFNLGNNRGYSVREIVACVEKVTGRPVPCVNHPRRNGDPPQLVASHDKIADALGWRPRRGLDEIVVSAWAWRQRHPRGYEG
ncbi:MAG: UDP-glucose 4-epimerase GalE [Acidobacteria bacterium]|nr:UDP-glucose 4-epimerase GalE [Acidobacteriota bacterium]